MRNFGIFLNNLFPILLFLILLIVLAIIKILVIKYVYKKIGLPSCWIWLFLLLSLFGSLVNIPLFKVSSNFPSFSYLLHKFQLGKSTALGFIPFSSQTTIAINLGGAIIPVLISFYLMSKVPHPEKTMISTFIVAIIVHKFTRPVPNLGLVVPTLLPAISSALISLILEKSTSIISQTAYISGSMGTLIGADLANLSVLKNMGMPLVSIGGAGTFDGIFLSGLMAALLI